MTMYIPPHVLTRTTYSLSLSCAPVVEKMMGNGVRRIRPTRLEVTVYQPGSVEAHLCLSGQSILRDGRNGAMRSCSWTIGGRWDESDQAPAWAVEIASRWIGDPNVTPYYADDQITLWHATALDALREIADDTVACIVTSPPYYGLRSYLPDTHPDKTAELGTEREPAEYVARLAEVLAECRRVLRPDGTMWLNLGDSYSTRQRGNDNGWDKSRLNNPARVQKAQRAAMRGRTFDRPAKNLLGIPWRVAFAAQDDGWTLRNDIIWHKPNAMPESVRDRLSTRHEHLFLLTKTSRYWFDLDAIREPHEEVSIKRAAPHRADPGRSAREGAPYEGVARRQTLSLEQMNHPGGRNPGDVWTIPTTPFKGAHFAAFPLALAERCILAGCRPGGVVLDPFHGSGTTGLAAARHGHPYIGIDLNADYLDLSLSTRLAQTALIGGDTDEP